MSLGKQILISAFILSLVALGFVAPGIAAILAIVCLIIYCIGYAKEHGVVRALLVFFKELLLGW